MALGLLVASNSSADVHVEAWSNIGLSEGEDDESTFPVVFNNVVARYYSNKTKNNNIEMFILVLLLMENGTSALGNLMQWCLTLERLIH